MYREQLEQRVKPNLAKLTTHQATQPRISSGAGWGSGSRSSRASLTAVLSARDVDELRHAAPGSYFPFIAGVSIQELDYGLLEDWNRWMIERGLGPKSRQNVLGAARTFLGCFDGGS